MKITLVRPTIELKQKALDYKGEHIKNGENIIYGSELLDKMDSYEEWFEKVTQNSSKETVDKNWVVTDTFFAIDETDSIVGIIDLRHELNDFLINLGNSGYSVRPSARKKGCATEMLRLLTYEAKKAGLKEISVSVERSNIGSIKVIKKNNGYYERSFEYEGKPADIFIIKL